MREDRIKYNHIRHTQEALDDVFDGLEHNKASSLSIAINDLVAFGLPLADNNNHEFECIMVDYQVPKLMNELYIEAWKRAKVVEAYLNHQMYDKNGDLWCDMIDELLNTLYKLI